MNARFGQNFTYKNKSIQSKKDDKKLSDIVCDYCHISRHMRDNCFALHTYPEWHGLYRQPKPKPRSGKSKKNAVTVVNSVMNSDTATASLKKDL